MPKSYCSPRPHKNPPRESPIRQNPTSARAADIVSAISENLTVVSLANIASEPVIEINTMTAISPNSTRCAACRYLRRRCSEDCALAPFFPATNPERFACVHRVFGASNVARMLLDIDSSAEQRRQAADAIAMEAYLRVQDPVYGSVGVISRLQREIDAAQRELAETQARIAVCAANRAHESTSIAGVLNHPI